MSQQIQHAFSQAKTYIALAPMDGLVDAAMRSILCAQGGIDHCVTEFIRVTQQPISDKVFYRYCPELLQGGTTDSNVPVHVQLLGSAPERMAESAYRAVELGAPAIDLNFGCPAKTVNRHQGGAVLLQYPDILFNIAHAVRQAVPKHIAVSAKMRLGYLDKSLALENAQALEQASMSWLCVHARTKTEGYQPPAHWDWVAQIRRMVNLPVFANGEIWQANEAQQCQKVSATKLIMLGRGLVATPDLAAQIKRNDYQRQSFIQRVQLLPLLAQKLAPLPEKHQCNRLKQWLHYMSLVEPQAALLFAQIKRMQRTDAILQRLTQFIDDKKS